MRVMDVGGINVDLAIAGSYFRCDLNRCRGACCSEGEAGARITDEEYQTYSDLMPALLSSLEPKLREWIDVNGWVRGEPGRYELALARFRGPCVFAVAGPEGVWSCAIETSGRKGLVAISKPISCELYPVRERVTDMGEPLLVYDQWDICSPGCTLGYNLQVPLYVFVKDALIRRFGADWYLAIKSFIENELSDENPL